jgi:hypothetical protein
VVVAGQPCRVEAEDPHGCTQPEPLADVEAIAELSGRGAARRGPCRAPFCSLQRLHRG